MGFFFILFVFLGPLVPCLSLSISIAVITLLSYYYFVQMDSNQGYFVALQSQHFWGRIKQYFTQNP